MWQEHFSLAITEEMPEEPIPCKFTPRWIHEPCSDFKALQLNVTFYVGGRKALQFETMQRGTKEEKHRMKGTYPGIQVSSGGAVLGKDLS